MRTSSVLGRTAILKVALTDLLDRKKTLANVGVFFDIFLGTKKHPTRLQCAYIEKCEVGCFF
jgi:hypothetical protein